MQRRHVKNVSICVGHIGGVFFCVGVALSLLLLQLLLKLHCHSHELSVELALSTAYTNAPMFLPFVRFGCRFWGVDCLFSAGEW